MNLASIKRVIKPFSYQLVSFVTRQRAQLRPEKMITEYRNGHFPLAGRLGMISWYEPEIRAIIPLDDRLKVGKRISKKFQSGYFEVTFDQAFERVIESCAEPRPGREYTWISRDLIDACIELHKRGYAHSVEVWREGQLVGGNYGIAIGGYFCGESMFTRQEHAGYIAMLALIYRLRERGFSLLDAQVLSPITKDFGGFEIPRDEFRKLQADAVVRNIRL
ncbi:MAG: leucyl/phenylalanyl-tRNA--protein transferase [Oscillochloris sp.]|nr:leucyl/phenylalanyl-tRNA--protein transferase [Oscillochloris sp.]